MTAALLGPAMIILNAMLSHDTPAQTAPGDTRFVGVVTRATSWVLDAVAINFVAIITGLGAELVLSLFPISHNFASILKPIAGIAYVVWAGAYFVVFWSWTGQTLGARVMQIRLLTGAGGRVKPARAVVRWVGMNLAMIPLFAGFAPILFRRRGFPDWLARTAVVEARQLSLARAGRATLRSAQAGRRGRTPAISGAALDLDVDAHAVLTPDEREPPAPGLR